MAEQSSVSKRSVWPVTAACVGRGLKQWHVGLSSVQSMSCFLLVCRSCKILKSVSHFAVKSLLTPSVCTYSGLYYSCSQCSVLAFKNSFAQFRAIYEEIRGYCQKWK